MLQNLRYAHDLRHDVNALRVRPVNWRYQNKDTIVVREDNSLSSENVISRLLPYFTKQCAETFGKFCTSFRVLSSLDRAFVFHEGHGDFLGPDRCPHLSSGL